MEASAAVAASPAARGGSVPIPQQPPSASASSRKEWRAVSEHRNAGDEELDRSKLGHSDERTIYEQGREPLDVDFCSITVDGSLDKDLLPQRLHNVSRQREELQRTEIELRAQIIARSEIMGMQSNFDAQIKEHVNAAAKFQEQVQEREQTIRELERKMEEKDRELHAIKLDNEMAWAKEDLLREQNKELASFRRERDHSEAERAQHIKQIHDLQEHIQDKERQLIDLQEQHRVAQETILYKDEQLREAQAWIARIQEMDVLQSNTNHSLQAELRERTEQYNQLWLGCQRQFAEMERVHLHAVQQLQLELADVRERNGAYNDESRLPRTNSKDVSQFGQSNGNQLDGSRGGASGGNSVDLPNGSSDNVSSFASSDNASSLNDHVPGVPMAPTSLLGMPTYLPPGQMTALHPYVMHQQGVPHSVPSHGGHFHSIPAMGSLQQWQNQQAVSEGTQISSQNEIQPTQADQSLQRSDGNYNNEISVNGQALHQGYLDVHMSQGGKTESGISASTGEAQVHESIDDGYLVPSQPQQSLQQISSQFRDALRLDTLDQNSENKESNVLTSNDCELEGEVSTAEQSSSVANPSASDGSIQSVNLGETTVNSATGVLRKDFKFCLSESFVSTRPDNTLPVGKISEPALLEERSLLACVVRTIPAGGRIRISSTLPNRLGKMLAPLHWHDYKKKYGKLEEFVVGHPELFVVEGDYIQLREGAQEMIAAEAALAKVAAAAAAAPSSYSSFVPSMAVTPVAQTHRLKKFPSVESKNMLTDKTTLKEYAVISPSSSIDEPPQFSTMQNQQPNGVGFGLSRGVSNIKLLSKSKDPREVNGPESRSMQSAFVGNGSNLNRTSLSSTQSIGSTNGRANLNFVGKQQGRVAGAAFASRR